MNGTSPTSSGFEHSRAVRWKEGQMYVDRAEYLVRLADALDVEPMLLVAMASGTLTVEQAHRQIGGRRQGRTTASAGVPATRRRTARGGLGRVAVRAGREQVRRRPGRRAADRLQRRGADGARGGARPARRRRRDGRRDPVDGALPGGALPPGAGVHRPRRGQRAGLRRLPRAVQPVDARPAPLPGDRRDRRR